MIDIPLREAQVSRVLGFLDEQLGDSDVTIVFGDSDFNGGYRELANVYLISNDRLNGYNPAGNLWVKNLGEYGRMNTRTKTLLEKWVKNPFYRTLEFGTEDGETEVLGISGPYAWDYSGVLLALINPYKLPRDDPTDETLCHECTHGITARHQDFITNYPFGEAQESALRLKQLSDAYSDTQHEKSRILNEGLGYFMILKYAERFCPPRAAKLRARRGRKAVINGAHAEGLRIMLEHEDQMQELARQILERNLARKAAGKGS